MGNHGASEADVTPAWRDHLAAYPDLLSADLSSMPNLMWIARLVHHHIGGHPVGSVAGFLHREVWDAAGIEE